MMGKSDLSSSSDSEDDVQMRQFLEAADTTLLTNEMFQQRSTADQVPSEPIQPTSAQAHTYQPQVSATPAKDAPKSQRYLADEESNVGTDLNLPAAVQLHISRKLEELIAQRVEFCVLSTAEKLPPKERKFRSKLKLLREADRYVKSYEEFEYETRGPEKKPHFRRRNVDQEPEMSTEERCRAAAIDAHVIINGGLLRGWAPRAERRNKVFNYRMGSTGLLHAKEATTEFTQLRRKNGWNEAKIRQHASSS